MKQKHIDAAREVRLWITQIVVPIVMLGTTTLVTVPEAREFVAEKFKGFKKNNKLDKES